LLPEGMIFPLPPISGDEIQGFFQLVDAIFDNDRYILGLVVLTHSPLCPLQSPDGMACGSRSPIITLRRNIDGCA